jgi:Bacterial regulatory helix-turn-helix protein, lysR family
MVIPGASAVSLGSSNTVWISPAPGASRAGRSGYAEPVSLAQIQYFMAVAEQGHVGRAASNLRIAQPAVSRQIRRLEEELGAALFTRTPRGMQLSAAGNVFLEHARSIMQGIQAAEVHVRQVAAGEAGGASKELVSKANARIGEGGRDSDGSAPGRLEAPAGVSTGARGTQKSARR